MHHPRWSNESERTLRSQKMAAQKPCYTAQRLFYASAATYNHYLEEYDFPSAYHRAESDPNFLCYIKQSTRSDGSPTFPGSVSTRPWKVKKTEDTCGKRTATFSSLNWIRKSSDTSPELLYSLHFHHLPVFYAPPTISSSHPQTRTFSPNYETS